MKKPKKERWLSRELRFLGMSQKALSELLGIHENTVSNWTTGETSISPVLFKRMLDLGIPVKALKDPSKEV